MELSIRQGKAEALLGASCGPWSRDFCFCSHINVLFVLSSASLIFSREAPRLQRSSTVACTALQTRDMLQGQSHFTGPVLVTGGLGGVPDIAEPQFAPPPPPPRTPTSISFSISSLFQALACSQRSSWPSWELKRRAPSVSQLPSGS